MLHGGASVVPQFGLHPPLWGLVLQLQAKILVKPIDPLAFTAQPSRRSST
ncbi:hypothetical protein MPC4_170059 [Methylocella tundrae]|uniref:Uncharacterized protein n=1 Tax=Methylocella tundrae TaxID=227605 RepID=A0A8B6M3X4_METTU|nr:hypothetical protein MPC4_170059 [Methylocella tundrae]